MFKKIIGSFNNLDKLTKIIMRNGLIFSAFIGLVALVILATYNYSFTFPILFTIGFVLFKLSLVFGIEFIICGFVVDGIKNH